jgi:hypothetical protein
VTIYIPTWLYWYGGLPLAFIVGYLLGRLHKREVPPDPYRHTRYTDKEVGEHIAMRRSAADAKEAPTTKRAVPHPGSVDKGAS